MLYTLLRFIFRIANRFYFRTLQVKGLENIPKGGPVCIVSNHPSAFMDPIVIATLTNRSLFFMAKGVLFQNKFSKWLLPKFHMIPIFRKNETPGQEEKNKEVFSHCHKHFAKGGAILVFPEGISLTERKIKKIKTGTARICLGAEAEYNFGLNIKIVTVGLNFSNPHKFQSDLFVNIDQPINVSDYYEKYKKDPFKAAHALTDEIRKRLEKQVVAIQDSDVDKLVSNIELVYKSQLLKELGHSPKEMESDFKTTKGISDSVHFFMEFEPLRVEKFKNEINTYLNDLERLSLTDNLIKGIGKSRPFFDALKSLCYLMIGFPIFVFGFINNFLPFKIPGRFAKVISRRTEFFGSLAISLGILSFFIFYTLQIFLVGQFFSDWLIILVYAVLMPVSGLFAFYYYRRFTTIRSNWKIFSLFYKKTKLIASLISRRQAIVEDLEKGKEDFMAYSDGAISLNEVGVLDNTDDVNNFFSLNI